MIEQMSLFRFKSPPTAEAPKSADEIVFKSRQVLVSAVLYLMFFSSIGMIVVNLITANDFSDFLRESTDDPSLVVIILFSFFLILIKRNNRLIYWIFHMIALLFTAVAVYSIFIYENTLDAFVVTIVVPIIFFFLFGKRIGAIYSVLFTMLLAAICGLYLTGNLSLPTTFSLDTAILLLASVGIGSALMFFYTQVQEQITSLSIDHAKRLDENNLILNELNQQQSSYVKEISEHNEKLKTEIRKRQHAQRELNRMNEFMVGREIKMRELKEKLTELKETPADNQPANN